MTTRLERKASLILAALERATKESGWANRQQIASAMGRKFLQESEILTLDYLCLSGQIESQDTVKTRQLAGNPRQLLLYRPKKGVDQPGAL